MAESRTLQNGNSKIYLVGSYTDFKERIIKKLPVGNFEDPKNHSQSSSAKMVYEDMRSAEECPILLVIFPEGKRGVMSYAELGASACHKNRIICIDEDIENPDPLLRKIASDYFTSADDAIEFLRSNPDLSAPERIEQLESKYQKGSSGRIPMKSIYICGTLDNRIRDAIQEAAKLRPDKNFILQKEAYGDLKRILEYDLLVAYFPKESDWDRHSCFMMGAAYAHDISMVVVDEHGWKYPPLQALARRHCTLEHLTEYLSEVDDLNVSREAVTMYNLFERERKKDLGNKESEE